METYNYMSVYSRDIFTNKFVLIIRYTYNYLSILQLYEFRKNLKMIRPENETEDLFLSFTKICETFIHQIHIRPEETLEFKMIKPRETFHFNPPIQVEDNWILGLIDLDVYNSFFNITKENNKFEFYRFADEKSGGVSYEKVKDETERDLDVSDFTATDLQDETNSPKFF